MICFDMDGVLVKYVRDDYVQRADGTYPFHQKGHYAHKAQDKRAVNLFNKCVNSCKGDVFVITSIPDIENSTGILIDKITWLDNNVDKFDIGAHLIAPTTNKMSHIEWIRGAQLRKSDILIDDFNDNLYSWMARGGTAIKYLNGINSKKSWIGPWLDGTNINEPMFIHLMEIVHEATR